MSNRQTFLTIYFVGTGLTLFCGLLLIYQVSFIAPKFLLVLGTTHVLGLFFLTVFRDEKSKRKIEDGNFIQTAGYLHTLIGFIVAVGLVGDNIANLNNLLSPLSSALITSLLGWWLGGFISSQGEHEEDSLKKEIANSVAEAVAETLDRELKQYTKGISKSFAKLNKESQSLAPTIESLNTTIENQKKPLSESLQGISNVLDSQRQPL